MGKNFKGDPRIIQIRFATNCKKCGIHLGRGTFAYYWPADRTLVCTDCGEDDFQEFLSSACDEDLYNGVGNPYCG